MMSVWMKSGMKTEEGGREVQTFTDMERKMQKEEDDSDGETSSTS